MTNRVEFEYSIDLSFHTPGVNQFHLLCLQSRMTCIEVILCEVGVNRIGVQRNRTPIETSAFANEHVVRHLECSFGVVDESRVVRCGEVESYFIKPDHGANGFRDVNRCLP